MIVALSAKKRCGKDTVAKMLLEEFGDKAEIYKLAWPIKGALYRGLMAAHSMGIISEYPSFECIDGEDESFDREAKLFDIYTAEVIFSEGVNYVTKTLGSTWEHGTVMLNRVREFLSNFDDNHMWSVRELMQQIGTDIGCYVDSMIWMRYMMEEYLEAMANNKVLVVTDCRQDHEMHIMRKVNAVVCHIIHPIHTYKSTDGHSTEKGLTVYDNDYVIYNDSTLKELNTKVNQLSKIIKEYK